MFVTSTDGKQSQCVTTPRLVCVTPPHTGPGTAMGERAVSGHGGAQQVGQHPPHQGTEGLTETEGHNKDSPNDQNGHQG